VTAARHRRGAREAPLELLLLFGAAACGVAAHLLGGRPAAPALSPLEAGTVRVVTWNVGVTGGPAGAALPAVDVAAVAATLRDLDFDLACVLELADAAQARALAAAVGGEVRVLVSPYARPLALLVRRGDLALRSAPPAPPAAASRPRRPRLLAAWTPRGGASEVLVAALHATPWSAQARNAEVGALAEALGRAESVPAMLLGDLNLEAQVEGRQDVFSDDGYLDVETYGYLTRTLVDTGRTAGATAQPDRRIDYVFASPDLAVVGAVVVRGRRRSTMDHDPLVVDLRLGASR